MGFLPILPFFPLIGLMELHGEAGRGDTVISWEPASRRHTGGAASLSKVLPLICCAVVCSNQTVTDVQTLWTRTKILS